MFRLSLVAVSRGHSLIAELGLWAGHVGSAAAAPGSGAQTPQLRCTALVALGQVVSSWTMNQTHIPCIGRQTLNHWTPGKSLNKVLKIQGYFTCKTKFAICAFKLKKFYLNFSLGKGAANELTILRES